METEVDLEKEEPGRGGSGAGLCEVYMPDMDSAREIIDCERDGGGIFRFVCEGAREVCRELDSDTERLGGGPSTICISSSSTSIAILSLEEDLPVESVAER